jgi:hypothetical protein
MIFDDDAAMLSIIMTFSITIIKYNNSACNTQHNYTK